MVTFCNIWKIKELDYDEVWATVRSPKKIPSKTMIHVPELSPSWKLFQTFQNLKKAGEWDEHTFQAIYVPQFLKEMKAPVAQQKLNELVGKSRQGKRIAVCCFCTDQALCHTSILAGIVSALTEVSGMAADYSQYVQMYLKA